MKFIKVPHSLNKNYFVENLAIEEIIKKAFSETKNVSLIKQNVKINLAATGFIVVIEARKSEKSLYSKVISELQEKIDSYSLNLIGTKSDNIEIIFN